MADVPDGARDGSDDRLRRLADQLPSLLHGGGTLQSAGGGAAS